MENIKQVEINDLPEEILINVFEKLNLSDLQAASLVCKSWYEITLMKKFQSKLLISILSERLNFFKIKFKDTSEPAIQFLKTNRKFFNLKIDIQMFEFNDCSKFFNKIGETIESLQFGDDDGYGFKMKPDDFFQILNTIKNPLKELIIKYRIIETMTPEDGKRFFDRLCNYCDDQNNVLSKLEKLDINFKCSNSHKFFIKLLKKNYSTLKSIKFNDKNLIIYESFWRLWKKMKLEEIDFNQDFEFEYHIWQKFKKLVFLQPSVKILNLFCFPNIPLKDLCSLAKNLNCITKIKPYFGVNNKKHQLKYLLKMKKLKVYDLNLESEDDNLTPNEIFKVFGEKKNYRIEALMLQERKFTEDQLNKLTMCYPNLVHLNLSINYIEHQHKAVVTDDVIQTIIKNLKLLRHLDLGGRPWLTDYGLTGRNPSTGKKRKNGCSISELTRLTTLIIDCCDELTDFTLINGIKFLELRKIDIGANENYTPEGLDVMLKNCPSIETLIFSPDEWSHLDNLRSAPRLKSFSKVCEMCYSEDEWQIKTFNKDKVLQPVCYNGCWDERLYSSMFDSDSEQDSDVPES